MGSGSELNRLASSLEEMENNREKFETDLEDAKQQFRAFDEKVDEIDRKITAALQKGDKEKLRKDLERGKNEIKRLDVQLGRGEQGTLSAISQSVDRDRPAGASAESGVRKARRVTRPR